MSKVTITADGLAAAIGKELTAYAKGVQDKVNRAGQRAIKKLETRTRDTAPFNARALHRHFVECIATKANDSRIGDKTFIWYVKAPCYRLTHLLVHGHATRNGGRTRANPFLSNALNVILPEYEKEVEEAVKSDG